MKENIHHMTQVKGNNKVTYRVYYKSGRTRTFTEKDNMPNNVLLFMLNSKNTETKVTSTGTMTRFY